jgi:hypothetical protein
MRPERTSENNISFLEGKDLANIADQIRDAADETKQSIVS